MNTNGAAQGAHGAEGTHQLSPSFHDILERSRVEIPVPYQLLKEIGRGRQGIVFQATRLGSRGCETAHAIKIFDPLIYTSAEDYWCDMGRISQQVARLHAQRSPHLVSCDFYEETKKIGFVQMEMIDGLNLDTFLRSGRHHSRGRNDVFFNLHEGHLCVQPGIVVYIMRQMLAGLETLHSAGYLHCDIKPSNVMIDPLGYVRIIDLGRAQEIADESAPRIGTPHYAAPELLRGGVASVQSDIYGVGMVGLELLTGQRIFPERNPTRAALERRKLQLLGYLRKSVPPYVRCNEELVMIMERFLAPAPEDRFPSAVSAEICGEGLATVHKQLTRMDIDSDYRRDLSHLLLQSPSIGVVKTVASL